MNMYAKNCTKNDLYAALRRINRKYEGNVVFNQHPEKRYGKGLIFTLKVKNSHGLGHRRGQPRFRGFGEPVEYDKRRHMPSACWHVHGDFFDVLFKIRPEAVITSRSQKITKDGGNWEDCNIGSQLIPYMFSEACDCE